MGAVCCADDTYVLSDTQSGLQSAINIVSHYAKRYRVVFNADKTKIVVTGSKVDMDYYSDISPWSLNGERITVVENNEHLGLVVSGLCEEQKNVDMNITKCRNSIFGLLGPIFAYSCKLSPTVQLHLWRLYCLPVLKSGLSSLPLRPTVIKPMQIFQNRILRGFLKLSDSSPVPCLYFLCGELPIEGKLHMDLLSIFYNVLANPQTKVFDIVKYILMMADSKSTTWSAHLRLICLMYGLPDPLKLMMDPPPSKSSWKTLTQTRITVFHEQKLRNLAQNNSKMEFMNVGLLGLSGKPHPIISGIRDSRDIPKLRMHLKFLTGDIVTGERLAIDRGSDPKCRICSAPKENIVHILTQCRALADIHERLHADLVNIIVDIDDQNKILEHTTSDETITQFVLDPTSMNLANGYRISILHPRLQEVLKISRDWCFTANSRRTSLLKKLDLPSH